MVDWTRIEERKNIINEILGTENKDRKYQSVKEVDVYRGILRPYVVSDLICQHGVESTREIPIVSSVNVAKRVVDNDSKLYAWPVTRTFEGVTENQKEVLKNIYDDMKADQNLLMSHRYLNLQQQNIIHILPKSGKIIMRVYKMHQIDAVPMSMNPEKAQSFIISNFDRTLFNRIYRAKSDGTNQSIADYDDSMLKATLFAVWDLEYQFIMNGKGEVVESNEIDSLTPGFLPFIDVYREKDFSFFTECGNELVDFTIQYNASLSNECQIVKMQGFAQPYLKGPSSIFSKDLKIGPDRLIKLPTDAINGSENVEFGYANPNSDLAGVREHRVQLLQDFLSTRNIAKSNFEGTNNYSSGIERLLSMVKDYERSREDMSIYQNAEDMLFESVKKWHNVLKGSELIDKKYQAGSLIPDSAKIRIDYKKPEMVQTEEEKIRTIMLKVESGITSKVLELMKDEKITEQQAIDKLKKISDHEEMDNVEIAR